PLAASPLTPPMLVVTSPPVPKSGSGVPLGRERARAKSPWSAPGGPDLPAPRILPSGWRVTAVGESLLPMLVTPSAKFVVTCPLPPPKPGSRAPLGRYRATPNAVSPRNSVVGPASVGPTTTTLPSG